MNMKKAIFWDNDGVLVNTEHLYYEASKQILLSVGINLTMDQYIEYFLKKSKGAWHLAANKGLSEAEINKLKADRNEIYGQLLSKQSNIIDGVKETLEYLDGRYYMGIVTSSKRNHFDIIHEKTGLLPYFNFVIANEDYQKSKPDPDPFLTCISTYKISGNIVGVEDSIAGISSLKGANITAVGVHNNAIKNFSDYYYHTINTFIKDFILHEK